MQILGLTCDNTAPNDIMMNELEDFIDGFEGKNVQI